MMQYSVEYIAWQCYFCLPLCTMNNLENLATSCCSSVSAFLPHLAVKGSKRDPLFLMANQQYLIIIPDTGISTQECNTHSFRIGVATSAKAAEISDLHIKMLGRWQSDVYHGRTGLSVLLNIKVSLLY